MPIYARERVSHLWLIHPSLQTLEVYRLEGQQWVVASSHVGAESVHAEPFEAIELDMSRWWLEEV
jgi:Uma2 family endonuclease